MFRAYFKKESSVAPLVVFRIFFGAVMLYGVARFAYWGWIDDLYVTPQYFFTYHGFEWVQPFSAQGMYILFFVMGLTAFFTMLGFLYRISIITFFICFTYVELIDKTTYLNHYYFISIAAFLLCLLPAHRNFSVDVWLRLVKPVRHIPSWMRDTLKFQLILVYVFAGIAKINYDWLIEAQPMKIWLEDFSWLNSSFMAYAFCWAGLLYDLFVPFVLLNKKYRIYGYAFVIIFHVLTRILFNIGMFPFIMIGATLIFFSDDFHEKIISLLRNMLKMPSGVQSYVGLTSSSIRSRIVLGVLALHFCVQVFLPFNYLLYPGELFWTEQGFRFSWRVMLIEKKGDIVFYVSDVAADKEIKVFPSQYLTRFQEKMMSTQPDMILQFSHFLRGQYSNTFKNPVVKVKSFVALNGRKRKRFIDPEINLAAQPISWKNKTWILPEF